MNRELFVQILAVLEITGLRPDIARVIRAHLDAPEQEQRNATYNVETGVIEAFTSQGFYTANTNTPWNLVREAQAQLTAMQQERDTWVEVSTRAEEKLAAIEAENAELRKDAERYRWIRNNDYLSVMDNAKWEYLDAAIDEARKEAQS